MNHSEAFRLDPEKQKFTALRPLPAATRIVTATATDRDTILLVGGDTDAGFTSACWLYDTVADVYRTFDPLPFANAGMLVTCYRNRIIAAGGEDGIRSRTARVLTIARP